MLWHILLCSFFFGTDFLPKDGKLCPGLFRQNQIWPVRSYLGEEGSTHHYAGLAETAPCSLI